MVVGEDINSVEAVMGNAVCDEENTAELLLIVLPEDIADIDDVEAVKGNAAQLLLISLPAEGEDIDGVEAVKGNAVCGEENAAELLPILLLECMAVDGDTDGCLDGVEVSEGWGLLEVVYIIVVFVWVLSNETIGVTV